MASAVVLDYADDLYLWTSDPPTLTPFPVRSRSVPPELLERIRPLARDGHLAANSASTAAAISAALGREVPLATVGEWRASRGALPSEDPRVERARQLRLARSALERALRTPEEILITLAREEERVERTVGREARAAESFLPVEETSIVEYARRWTDVRASLDQHHAALEAVVHEHARAVVPNLSAVVGARTAARLVAEAGGVSALARMRAPRIQLLGSRRRPSAERGPRYGLLFRADGMADVPPGRRGAYARSLAALAAIAVRADATTHASISRALVARRDRRIVQLRGRRG